jgi:hypothetical protein
LQPQTHPPEDESPQAVAHKGQLCDLPPRRQQQLDAVQQHLDHTRTTHIDAWGGGGGHKHSSANHCNSYTAPSDHTGPTHVNAWGRWVRHTHFGKALHFLHSTILTTRAPLTSMPFGRWVGHTPMLTNQKQEQTPTCVCTAASTSVALPQKRTSTVCTAYS